MNFKERDMCIGNIGLILHREKEMDFINDPFDGKENVSVVYLGGSITEGTGSSSPEKSWVGIISRELNNAFPKKHIEHHNSGIGGTNSKFGLMRIVRDVINYQPDLLFIEFAVNDSGSDKELFALESILLTLNESGLSPRIVFILTAFRDEDRKIARDKFVTIGQHYNIPIIDLQKVIDERRKIEDISQYFCDVCHPSDKG